MNLSSQTEISERVKQSASRVYEPGISPVGQELLLPFERMGEYDFERLCTRLASSQSDVQGARRYGVSGEAQYGIDIYARQRDKAGYSVYQCKRYKHITKAMLENIIEKFIEDSKKPQAPEWLKESKAFVLCITQPLEKAAFTKVVENTYQGLSEEVELDVWDTVKLTELLRDHPDIVEEFFGRAAAERLCGRGSLLEIRAPLHYDPDVTSPSQLLIASNRVVPFAGRTTVVAELEAWCDDKPRFAAKLITGAGGVGKTRLMLEFASECRARGWVAGFTRASDSRNEQSHEWQALLERERATLIVIDYAESRINTIHALLEAAEGRYQQRTQPIRLILLARGGDEWWTDLKTRPLLGKATTLALPAPETLSTSEQRRQEFDRAVAAFSEALNPEHSSITASAPPNLDHPSFQRLLYVHMLALLECQGVRLQNGDGVAVLEGTLAREREHWSKQLAAHSSSLAGLENRKGVERTMTLVTLGYPVPDFNAACALIRCDPVLGKDLDEGETRFLAGRLHTNYPGRGYISPVEPDLLAEHLIYTQLNHAETGGALIEAAFGRASPEVDEASVNLEPALAHLVRLAEWQPGAFALWRTVFSGRLNNVALTAADTPLLLTAMQLARGAITRGSELGDLLAELLEASGNTFLAMQAKAVLPYYSVSLLKFTEVTWRMALVVSNEEERLIDLGNHINSLIHLGFHHLALQKTLEAVKSYQKLTAINPEKFFPGLAMSLSNQSYCQSALGDRNNALKTIKKSVKLYRKLVLKDREKFLPSLAMSLNNQSNCQSALNDQFSAFKTIKEAVSIRRELVSKNRDVFLPALAINLNNQSNYQSALGDQEGAFETIREVVLIRRELTLNDRDAFLPYLASSLNNQSNFQSALGDYLGALTTIKEAVSLHRELVSRNRYAFLPGLAMSLNNQSNRQSDSGDLIGALESSKESIVLYEELSTRTPGAFDLDYAFSIKSLSDHYLKNNEKTLALHFNYKAVQTLTPVFEAYPDKVADKMRLYIQDYIVKFRLFGVETDINLFLQLQSLSLLLIHLNKKQLKQIINELKPLLKSIVRIAIDRTQPRIATESALSALEQSGWRLYGPINRIWNGERNVQVLTDGLSIHEKVVIHAVLELIDLGI